MVQHTEETVIKTEFEDMPPNYSSMYQNNNFVSSTAMLNAGALHSSLSQLFDISSSNNMKDINQNYPYHQLNERSFSLNDVQNMSGNANNNSYSINSKINNDSSGSSSPTITSSTKEITSSPQFSDINFISRGTKRSLSDDETEDCERSHSVLSSSDQDKLRARKRPSPQQSFQVRKLRIYLDDLGCSESFYSLKGLILHIKKIIVIIVTMYI